MSTASIGGATNKGYITTNKQANDLKVSGTLFVGEGSSSTAIHGKVLCQVGATAAAAGAKGLLIPVVSDGNVGGTPPDGTIWYNAATNKLMVQANGSAAAVH